MKDKIYNILQVTTIIIVISAIIIILLFFWMIYRLATYDHCRDINFTEPICEKYRNFWKEKTEMKNLINYIYITKEGWNNACSSISKSKEGGGYLINLTSIGGII